MVKIIINNPNKNDYEICLIKLASLDVDPPRLILFNRDFERFNRFRLILLIGEVGLADRPFSDARLPGEVAFLNLPDRDVRLPGEVAFLNIPDRDVLLPGEVAFLDLPFSDVRLPGDVAFLNLPDRDVRLPGEVAFLDLPDSDVRLSGEVAFVDLPDSDVLLPTRPDLLVFFGLELLILEVLLLLLLLRLRLLATFMDDLDKLILLDLSKPERVFFLFANDRCATYTLLIIITNNTIAAIVQ